MNAANLEIIDQWIYDFLLEHVKIMPKRLTKMIAYYYTDARIRKIYWDRMGVKMGEGTYSNLGLMVVPSESLPCVFIDKNVSIAPNVTLICNSNPNNGCEIKKNDYVAEKLIHSGNIHICDDVWIGANVTVLPGITIGKCSVIGAGSVVINDVEPYSVYAGVPARKIRELK